MTGGYWHNLALIAGFIIHCIPGALTIMSGFMTLGLLVAILVCLDGADIELPTWLAMILLGPVAFLALLPWCMEVYS
jgi:hypothetical protein